MSKPNPFGSSTEAIYQTLVRSALPLSTNDIFQSLVSKGLFQDVPAKNARLDIAAKLRSLKTRGVISRMDDKVGKQMWQLEPDTRAALPPEKTAKPIKPKAAAKPIAKAEPIPATQAVAPMITREAAANYKTHLRCSSHLFDAHAMGIFDLTKTNIETIAYELKRIADELEQALVTADEVNS